MAQQTSLNLGTIGQRLEAARLEKGDTVSDAGENTRILPKVIEAMESDDFVSLSAPVYVKGFIRLYAQYLGLDPTPLVNEYAGETDSSRRTPMADEVKQNLLKADVPPSEDIVKSSGRKRKIFSEAQSGPSDGVPAFPIQFVVGGVALVLLGIVLFLGIKQCDGDEADVLEPQTPSPAARTALFDDVPDVYLVRPGKLKLEQ